MRSIYLLKLVAVWLGLGFGVYRFCEATYQRLIEPAPVPLRVDRIESDFRGQRWVKLEGHLQFEAGATAPGAQPGSVNVLVPVVPVGWRSGDPVRAVVAFDNLPTAKLDGWKMQHLPGHTGTVTGTRLDSIAEGFLQQKLPGLNLREPVLYLKADQEPMSLATAVSGLIICLVLLLLLTWWLYVLIRGPRTANDVRSRSAPPREGGKAAVPVGRPLTRWKLYVPLILGALALLVAGGMLADGDRRLAAVFGFPGLLLAPIGPFLWWLHRRDWMQVLDRGDGFYVFDRLGWREFRDDEVLGVALVDRKRYKEGVPVGRIRQLTVWVPNGRKETQLDLTTSHPLGEAGPLDGLIQRLCDRLYEQARQERARGEAIHGQAWSLRGNELTLRLAGRQHIVCSYDEVVASRVSGDQLQIWESGIDEAVRLPLARANTFVLARMLTEDLAKRQTDLEPEDGEDLGRILYEVSGHTAAKRMLLITLLVALLFVLFLIFPLLGVQERLGIYQLITGIGVPLGLLATLVVWFSVFRCHAFGLYKRALGKEQIIWFDEVGEMTYSATRLYVNGIFMGVEAHLRLKSAKGKTFDKARTSWNGHEDLDFVRDHVAGMISRRWLRRFRKGEPVAWTSNLCFVPGEGLEYRPRGWVGRKGGEILPLATIRHFAIEDGVFYLWSRHQQKPVFEEPVSRPNFFPGYFLLIRLMTQR